MGSNMLKVNKNNQFGPKSGLNGLKTVEKWVSADTVFDLFWAILGHFEAHVYPCIDI